MSGPVAKQLYLTGTLGRQATWQPLLSSHRRHAEDHSRAGFDWLVSRPCADRRSTAMTCRSFAVDQTVGNQGNDQYQISDVDSRDSQKASWRLRRSVMVAHAQNWPAGPA